MIVCDKCGNKISTEAKFCPQCGDPVDEKDIVTDAIESSIKNAQIIFGYSSSQNYKKAIDICDNLPSYTTEGSGKQIINKVTLPLTEIELVINIYDIVGSWKSSKMLINGIQCTKKDLVYYGLGCFRERIKSSNKKMYCFGHYDYEKNIWGCKRIGMPLYGYMIEWMQHGEFDAHGVWHFDKTAIKNHIDIALEEIELCPALDKKRVYEALDAFPSTADPKNDDIWEYIRSTEKINGDYKEIAVGVTLVENKSIYFLPDDNFGKFWGLDTQNNKSEEPQSKAKNSPFGFLKNIFK